MSYRPRPLVLVVESDDDIRSLAKEVITDAGCPVVESHDMAGAKERLRREPVDLILCDVRVPGFEGLELLHWVRRHPTLGLTPFLLVSSASDKFDVRAAISLGADDLIAKPFLPEELLAALSLRLERAAKLSELHDHHRRFLSEVLPQELRRPLNAILNCGYLLDEAAQAGQSVSPSAASDLGKAIHRSSHHLLRFAEDLSLWARLQGQLELTDRTAAKPQRFETAIDPLALENTLRKSAENHGRGRDLRVNLNAAKVYVATDAVGLVTAVRHLVENALKFSQTGELVEVAGYPLGTNYVFEVRDQGQGLSPADDADPQSGRSIEPESLGVGLSTVRALARLSGGAFDLSSSTVSSTGATACLELPLAQTPLRTQPWAKVRTDLSTTAAAGAGHAVSV